MVTPTYFPTVKKLEFEPPEHSCPPSSAPSVPALVTYSSGTLPPSPLRSMFQKTLLGALKGHPRAPSPSQQPPKPDNSNQKGKPTSNMRNNRSADLDGVHMSRKEIESLPGHKVTSAETGLQYLESTLLTVPGVSCTTEALVTVLYQITMLPGVRNSCPSVNAIRAVAYLLANNEVDAASSSLADAVTSKVEVCMATLIRESAAAAAEVWDGLVKTTAALKSQLEAAAEKTLGNIQAAMQAASNSTVKLSKTSSKYCDALLRPATQTGPLSAPHLSHFPPRLKAREGIKARQVVGTG